MAVHTTALAATIAASGWRPHQPLTPVIKVEDGSGQGLPLDAAAREVAARLQHLCDSHIAGLPPPTLQVPLPFPNTNNALRLTWAAPPPCEASFSFTSPKTAVAMWRQLVHEVAAGWAVPQEGLSYGLVFLTDKDRLIFWPRLVNEALAPFRVRYGSVFDLFTRVAACGVKVDLKAAFRAIAVHSDDAPYLACCLDGVPMVFHRLPFGLSISPAVFVHTLAITLSRFRASTPNLGSVMSVFVDDTAAADRDALSTLLLAERLVTAFLSDGWWVSLSKAFLWPTTRLLFTGLIAAFDAQAVSVAPSKAAKLRRLLNTIRRPDASLLPPSPPPTAPGPAGPRVIAEALATTAIHILEGSVYDLPRDPSIIVAGPTRLTYHRHLDTSSCAGRAGLARAIAGASGPVVVALPAALAAPLAAELPLPTHPILLLVPPHTFTQTSAARSDDRSHDALPPHIRPPLYRPLPLASSLPEHPRRNPTLFLDSEDYGALLTTLGFVSWLQATFPFLAALRRPLDTLLRLAVWDEPSLEAFDALRTLALSIDDRLRPAHLAHPVLTVTVDSGRTGWGAICGTAHGSLVRFAGFLPPHVLGTSSTARELYGARQAIVAAFRLGNPIASVIVILDSTAGVGAASGGVRSHALLHTVRTFAAWETQGLRVDFRWESREDGAHPLVDALASLAGPDWTLKPFIASYLWDMTGGWDIDMAASESSALARQYTSLTLPPAERHLMLAGATRLPAAAERWMGLSLSYVPPAHHLAFAFPRRSLLPQLVRHVATNGIGGVIVAPSTPEDWWAPAVAWLSEQASFTFPLPLSSSEPPVELRNPADRVDPRPLTAFFIRARTPTPRSRGRPLWWTPYRLTADGDVEDNPGPSVDDFTSLSPAHPSAPTIDAVHCPAPSPKAACPSVHIAHLTQVTSRPSSRVDRAPLGTTPSIGGWLRSVIGAHTGETDAGTTDTHDPVRSALASDITTADAVLALRARVGSSRAVRVPILFLQLAQLTGTLHLPFTPGGVAALCVAYAVRRLHPSPPLGWRRVSDAATIASDISALAEASRRTHVPLPPYCGDEVRRYLAARGAFEKREHSAAWPLHIGDIVHAQPPRSHASWDVWAALFLYAMFCLRPGILPHIRNTMFIPYLGGYIFVWRLASKRGGSDILDLAQRSKVAHVTAARSPLLHAIIRHSSPPFNLFSSVTSAALNMFVRGDVRDAPSCFDVRAYGARVGADAEAAELHLPTSYNDAIFWWRREQQSMRVYYSGLNILKMMAFSEARDGIEFVQITPGRYAARLTRPPPDWSEVTLQPSPLPPASIVAIQDAWDACSPSLVAARTARATKIPIPPWVFPGPGTPPPPPLAVVPRKTSPPPGATRTPRKRPRSPPSDSGSALSVDCNVCTRHISRHRFGSLCDGPGCDAAACAACHSLSPRMDWLCGTCARK